MQYLMVGKKKNPLIYLCEDLIEKSVFSFSSGLHRNLMKKLDLQNKKFAYLDVRE